MWIWPGRRSRWITFDPDTLSQLVSEHYSRMVLTVEADYEGGGTPSGWYRRYAPWRNPTIRASGIWPGRA